MPLLSSMVTAAAVREVMFGRQPIRGGTVTESIPISPAYSDDSFVLVDINESKVSVFSA